MKKEILAIWNISGEIIVVYAGTGDKPLHI
jgi:hypothetical protein